MKHNESSYILVSFKPQFSQKHAALKCKAKTISVSSGALLSNNHKTEDQCKLNAVISLAERISGGKKIQRTGIQSTVRWSNRNSDKT